MKNCSLCNKKLQIISRTIGNHFLNELWCSQCKQCFSEGFPSATEAGALLESLKHAPGEVVIPSKVKIGSQLMRVVVPTGDNSNSGFQAILDGLSLEITTPNFRDKVVDFFHKYIDQPPVAALIFKELQAQYMEYAEQKKPMEGDQVYDHYQYAYHELRPRDPLSFRHYEIFVENRFYNMGHKRFFLDHWLRRADIYPHASGSLAALAYINHIRLRCAKLLPYPPGVVPVEISMEIPIEMPISGSYTHQKWLLQAGQRYYRLDPCS